MFNLVGPLTLLHITWVPRVITAPEPKFGVFYRWVGFLRLR